MVFRATAAAAAIHFNFAVTAISGYQSRRLYYSWESMSMSNSYWLRVIMMIISILYYLQIQEA